ncbi:M66 family metalloprotease [Alishewanella sp. d11]|uniref:M66 family metalloprotease n=1 Tax=Alishewanella sp. d11 TaxID=3414030 RepID=UPI003BF7C2B6
MLRNLKVVFLATTIMILTSCGSGSSNDDSPSQALNRAPVIVGVAPVVVEEQFFQFKPTVSDPDHDQLTFSINNKPAWLNFNTVTGELSGIPRVGDAAKYENITISASDGKLATPLTFTIEVVPAERVILSLASAVHSAAYIDTIDPDFDSVEISFSLGELPSWATFDEKNRTISGFPDQLGINKVALLAKSNKHTWILQGEIIVKDSNQYAPRNLIDFYSKNYDGAPRLIRNDLTGALSGEVQFIQSHSVAPNNNFNRNTTDETQSRYMPNLVALRDALILFIPDENTNISSLSANLKIHGEVFETIQLKHPNTLPLADVDNGSTITYSTKAWWGHIPWQFIKNGLAIDFITDSKTGSLLAEAIEIGEASQLVLKSIRLGMLTSPEDRSGHFTLRDPVLAATDYFQTIPTSKLILASYADMILDKVIVATGQIYDKNIDQSSQTEGSVYNGDMRENVAKSQVSTGINLADSGYTSNNMRQSYPHLFKQITNHHAWGQYINGRILHGLSGGNGIGTLIDSKGNEASHEWGHAYGLGHYPGQQLTSDGRWAVHHADSGWGFIAHRKRLRSNIATLNADGSRTYHRDAMSGGYSNSQFSSYTHHTGYSARVIQNNLASFPIADAQFATGYKKWDLLNGQYRNFQDNNNRPIPIATGVAVATILGGYDPISYKAVIYPVFHGNYGNVFNLPAPDLNSDTDQCWLTISNQNNESQAISVAATRHHASSINQLHLNLPADFKPTLAILNCRHNGITTELTRTAFDGKIPELPELAIVGQEHAFNQLKQREFLEIENALSELAEHIVVLPTALAVKVASYDLSELTAALSPAQSAKLTSLLTYNAAAVSTQILLRHAEVENIPDQETAMRLKLHLAKTGLLTDEDIQPKGEEIFGNNLFFDGRTGENTQVALTLRSSVESIDRTTWFQDAVGRLHDATQPWLCLTQQGNALMLRQCQADNPSQRWLKHNDNPLLIKNTASGQCLDLDRANTRLISYACHGGTNQRWEGVTENTQLWLALLDGQDIKQIMALLVTPT